MNQKRVFIGANLMQIEKLQKELVKYEKDFKYANYVIENKLIGTTIIPLEKSIKKIEQVKAEIEKYKNNNKRLEQQLKNEELVKC